MDEGNLRRHQREKTRSKQGKIVKLWEKYEVKDISTSKVKDKVNKVGLGRKNCNKLHE